MGGRTGQRGSEQETGLRALRRARSSAAWSPHQPFSRCFSASLGASVCWGGRCQAPGMRGDRGGWRRRHVQGHDHPARCQWGRRRPSALRHHAQGGASTMVGPYAPRPPGSTWTACAGGSVDAHGARLPTVARARQGRKRVGRWEVSMHHAARPAAQAPLGVVQGRHADSRGPSPAPADLPEPHEQVCQAMQGPVCRQQPTPCRRPKAIASAKVGRTGRDPALLDRVPDAL